MAGETYEEFALREVKAKARARLPQRIKYLSQLECGNISNQEMENSIYNIYRAKGMGKSKAKNFTERTMDLNERRACHIYDNEATNCFVSGREQRIEV